MREGVQNAVDRPREIAPLILRKIQQQSGHRSHRPQDISAARGMRHKTHDVSWQLYVNTSMTAGGAYLVPNKTKGSSISSLAAMIAVFLFNTKS